MTSSARPDGHEGPDRLQRLLLDLQDIDQLLGDLARLATGVVDAPATCGITVRYEHGLMTVGSSDRLAEVLDETQYSNGDGPCLQSLRSGRVVEVPDMRQEDRWPAYGVAALAAGVRCSTSLPLGLDGVTFGAMNVYGFDRPGLFGPGPRRELELFAAQAAGTLRVAIRQLTSSTLLTQMEESLRSRTVIDQALGVIMRDQRCTAAAAFELLRRESQNNHRRLRDVAADLIERTTGHAPEAGRPFDRS